MKIILNALLLVSISFATIGCSDKGSNKTIQCDKELINIMKRLKNNDETAALDLVKWEETCKIKDEKSWIDNADYEKDPSKYKKTTRRL